MGFSYSNSCDLFGPKFCDVMRGVISGGSNHKNRDYDNDLNERTKLLNKRVDDYFKKKFLI